MTSIRVWQNLEPLDGVGAQVVTSLEIDLAYSPMISRSLELSYVPFRPHQANPAILDFAQTLNHYGLQAPDRRSILLLRKGAVPEHFDSRYPGLARPMYRGSTLVSANVAESTIVFDAVNNARLEMTSGGPVEIAASQDETRSWIVANLWREGRLTYIPSERSDLRVKNARSSQVDLVLPFNPSAGYLSREAKDLDAIAAFTAGFFIFWDYEFEDPYSFTEDPVGLVIVRGRVVNAPLYRRSALIFSSRNRANGVDDELYSVPSVRPLIKSVSLENYAIRLPHDVCVIGRLFREHHVATSFGRRAEKTFVAELNPLHPPQGGAAFYTRLLGLKSGAFTFSQTPPSKDRVEFTISGEEICGVHEGGETFIPGNAFVLSLPASPIVDRVVEQVIDLRNHLVEQAIDLGDDALAPSFGVQVGLQLVRNGRRVDIEETLREGSEEYVPADRTTREPGVPPRALRLSDITAGRTARLGFGIRRDHRCFVVLIEGCEARSYVPEADSPGGTNDDLATHLLELGCCDAVALDGGGSAQIVCGGRSTTRVGDRHDIPLVPFERPVPGGWMVQVVGGSQT